LRNDRGDRRLHKDIVSARNTHGVVAGATAVRTPVPPTASVDLSVIFVARNEESHIEDCIRSTMAAAEDAVQAGIMGTVEYILADSASTDRTVAIASQFPVRIVRLEPSWPLSCSAGCYIGIGEARGTFAAIINTDMTVDRRFFTDIIPYFSPDVGAVSGVAKEDLSGRTVVERLVIRYSSISLSFGTLPRDVAKHPGGFSAGTLIVRTEAVRRVGSYNPFFRAAEDADVRHKLLRAGWRVLDVPVLQGLHFWASVENPLDVLEYHKTILRNSIGLGQMARYHASRDSWISRRAANQAMNARTLINGLPGLGWLVLLGTHLLGVATWNLPLLLASAAADVVVAASASSSARRDRIAARDWIYGALASPPIYSLVRTLGFARGWTMPRQGPEDYPGRAAPDPAA